MIHSNPTHNTTDGRTKNDIKYNQVTNYLDNNYKLVKKEDDKLPIADRLFMLACYLLAFALVVVLINMYL